MLKKEHAQERLKEFGVDGRGLRLARTKALPTELREITFVLQGYDAQGKEVGYEKRNEALNGALDRLDALGCTERTQVFTCLFPKMGPQVEGAWRLLDRLPYQTGYGRKAFRTPNGTRRTRLAHHAWLTQLLHATANYEQDAAWFAAWAPYLGYYSDPIGVLFAAAIDAGGAEGEEVFDILLASARGEHEIGAMGRHVTRALLVASRPEGWEFIEKLLLAAQRQEGLRQTILETIDEAHPEAFRRILRLILENDLIRFSATVRAICVWFGYTPDEVTPKMWTLVLQHLLLFLEDHDARAQALTDDDDPNRRFLALWIVAFEDAFAAIEPAQRMLADARPDHRLMAVKLLGLLGLPEAYRTLLPALDDADLVVAAQAFETIFHFVDTLKETDLFERLERLIARMPEERKAGAAGAMFKCLGDRSPLRLLPYLAKMDAWSRRSMPALLTKNKEWTPEIRETLFALVGDLSPDVREEAVKALAASTITEVEVAQLEGLLSRKASDLRRGVLSLLAKQDDDGALASAERLVSSKEGSKRLAGLELMREMVRAGRSETPCRESAQRYQQGRPRRTEAEEGLLSDLLDEKREAPTLKNGLGLFDPEQRTKPTPPRIIEGLETATKESAALLLALDELVHQQRETPVVLTFANGSRQERLLGNIQWGFPTPNPAAPLEEDLARLPLSDLWLTWLRERPANLRDRDGGELLRALAFLLEKGNSSAAYLALELREKLAEPKEEDEKFFRKIRYVSLVSQLLMWMLRVEAPQGVADFLLDAMETSFAQVPKDLLEWTPGRGDFSGVGWRGQPHLVAWLMVARTHRSCHPDLWTDVHLVRFWGLLRWMDEPGTELPRPRFRPPIEEAVAAYRAGGATEADLLDILIGSRTDAQGNAHHDFSVLRTHSVQKPTPLCKMEPMLYTLVDRCRRRIVEVELARGEMPTAASIPAVSLRWSGGGETLVKLLARLGAETLTRSTVYYGSNNLSKTDVFSEMIRRTAPTPEETPEAFVELAKAVNLSAERWVETALFTPHWARYIEAVLGWDGFAQGVWWVHAHTKDEHWGMEKEMREAWASEIGEQTPLSSSSLIDGAVDVDWFHKVHAALGADRWAMLSGAARYASGGQGHKRAQLFADAMLGKTTRTELLNRIKEKRNQDSVRALGLLPLAEGEERAGDLLERYQVLQEFLRTSRQFGSQRQASEKLAAQIGMENLARTAGYADPIRLQWAMEAQAVADLAQGPATVEQNGVSVSLSINSLGRPDLTVVKQGKQLQAIPAAMKKSPEIVALQERKREIERQASRMRLSLEQAMCRGDRFTGREVRELLAHPVLAPMLRSLVFAGDGVAGYPIDGGRALEACDGEETPIALDTELRIAHPYDLLHTGAWEQWQRDCFRRERVQPFKQVFRELYVLTSAEEDEGNISKRYEGHQVNPRQALALLGSRGWVSRPEEGVYRTFHAENLTVMLTFDYGFFTPAEVEGLTIEGVAFRKRGEWAPVSLTRVPPRLFSEVMRDVDLIVSVAHQGGVDPEASRSTVEMRAALLRESCALLKMSNVRLESQHALIDGDLGTYSVHLGSAVVHRQPGGALCIVPVHSQHRGRLFLPFADDDPKTAEVLSKVLLLSRDKEIKDPTILEQILTR